jgi:hypothetical protein
MSNELKEVLRANTVPAVELLCEFMHSKTVSPAIRVRCIELLLERSLGKAVQPIFNEVDIAASLDLSSFSVEELKRLAALDEMEVIHDTASSDSAGSV